MPSKRKINDNEKDETIKKRVKVDGKDLKESIMGLEKCVEADENSNIKEKNDATKGKSKLVEVKGDYNIKEYNPDLADWPSEHVAELLNRLDSAIPKEDHLTYTRRVEKIDWNDIAFNNYSGEECREMWEGILSRQRQFRFLREILDDAKTWLSKPWTNFYRRRMTKAQPDKPRRPTTAYMLFYKSVKSKIKEEQPKLTMIQLSKHISEMYKNLSPETKLKYKEMSAAESRKYKVEKSEFYERHPELGRNKKKKKPKNVPPRPATPFKMFYEDLKRRVEHDDGYNKRLFKKKCKEKWCAMSDKNKLFWITWALEKEAKYIEEIKKYVEQHPEYVPSARRSVINKQERVIKNRFAGKPEKPPKSAYSLFTTLMLISDDIKQISPKERMFLIDQQWEKCSDEEKQEFSDRLKHLTELYQQDYDNYLQKLSKERRKSKVSNKSPKKSSKEIEETEENRIENTPKKSNNNKKDLYEGEPMPPPTKPFLLFKKYHKEKYSEKNDAKIVWKTLTQSERDNYQQLLEKMKQKYIKKYEKFLKNLPLHELKKFSEFRKINPRKKFVYDPTCEK